MATKKKPAAETIKDTNGKTIRFSLMAHSLLRDFTKERGYNLGAFCEKAALDKMVAEKAALGGKK